MYVYTSAVDLDGTLLPVENDRWVQFSKSLEVFYASPKGLSIKRLYEQINSLQPEVVYINGLFTPYTVLYPLLVLRFLKRKNNSSSPKVVIAPRGMLKSSALALKAGKKRLYLKLFKSLGMQKEVYWQATDPQEFKDIVAFAGKDARVGQLGNVPLIPSQPASRLKETGKLRLLSVSLVARTKNLLFLLKCLKELPAGIEIQYDIYGPIKEDDYWQKLKGEMENLTPNIQVNYKGAVLPDEVTATLQQYDCFVLPTLGENFGHAIFEALAAGIPVLISDQTPWRKLELQKAGWDLPLQEGAWIEKIQQLIALPEGAFRPWRKGAHAYAVAYLEQQDLKQQYLALFGIG